MFKIFKNNPVQRLQKRYDRLMEHAYKLSHINRMESSRVYAEAERVMQQIEQIQDRQE